MNRGHTADDYRRVIERLRAARPDIALSSDFIVGFPGESDADFAATLALVREIGFAQAFSFKYSTRPGTPGAALREPDRRTREIRAAADRAGAARRAAAALQRALRRPRPAGAVRKAGPASGPARRPQPHIYNGSMPQAPARCSARSCRCGSPASGPTAWRARSRRFARGGGARDRRAGRAIEALQMQFDDNSLLPAALRRARPHLERIERELGVSLVSRGNRLAIAGPQARADVARTRSSRSISA